MRETTRCPMLMAMRALRLRLITVGVISHPDDRDMTCVSAELRARASTRHTLPGDDHGNGAARGKGKGRMDGVRIGIPIQTHLPEPYIQLPRALLQYLRDQGAELQAVDLTSLKYTLPAYYVLASAEASSNLARFGGGWYGSCKEREAAATEQQESGEARRRRVRTEGFGSEVRKRILAGTHALSAE